MRKLALLLLISIFFIGKGFTQTQQTTKFENNQLRISAQLVDCSDRANGIYIQYQALQFENKTNNELKVDYYKEMWFNEQCFNCEETESNQQYNYNITLQPLQVKKGSCEARKNRSMMVYSKHLDFESKSKLTGFNIRVLNIK